MQLFGDLNVLSFVRIRRLNWIGHVNRMDNKRKTSQGYNTNLQGSQLTEQPNNRWWNYIQTVTINTCKITNWKERSKTELAGRSFLRR